MMLIVCKLMVCWELEKGGKLMVKWGRFKFGFLECSVILEALQFGITLTLAY